MGVNDEARTRPLQDFGLLQQFGRNLRDLFALLFRTPRPLRLRPRWLAPWRLVIGLSLALAATTLAVLFLDVPASTGVRYLPLWVVSTFDTLTEFGKSGWFLFPLGLFLLALAAITPRTLRPRDRLLVVSFALRLTFIFAAIALPGLFVTVLKGLIGRARPFVEPDGGSFVIIPFRWNAEYASIPSGHGATAFAAAVAIGAVWPVARPIVWLYALLIAASRVVVTAHYPSDLLASAFVGVLGAMLVRHTFAVRRLAFVIDRNGAAQPLPGPSLRRLKSVARRLWSQ